MELTPEIKQKIKEKAIKDLKTCDGLLPPKNVINNHISLIEKLYLDGKIEVE